MFGVLLILSCQSYYQRTLSKIKISPCFDNIIRVNVIGGYDNNTISYDEKLGYLLKLSCPDDYLHLLEKYCSSLKYIYNIFRNIKGVLRCCDDVDLTEQQIKTIFQQDYDYSALTQGGDRIENAVIYDCSIYDAIKRFPTLIEQYPCLKNTAYYSIRPYIKYCGGTCLYLSNKCNNIILDWAINHNSFSSIVRTTENIFIADNIPNTRNITISSHIHPYLIDDVGIGYILKQKNIFCQLFKT